MLRRQDPHLDPMSFMAGPGEMAARIRNVDWSNHPFGPSESWPQSLRSALGICLNSAFPAAIYWGGELRLLYNDAWAPITGPRHPAALGAPAREVWSDIWHVIEPQFMHLIETGEGIFVEDQMLPMRRYGVEEETYWTYSFTPIRGESGAIEGVFNSGIETTQNVLQRRYSELLVRLGDAYRASDGAAEMHRVAVGLVGETLRVNRVGLRVSLPGTAADSLAVAVEWTAPGVEPLGRSVELSDLAGSVREDLLKGRVVRIDGAGGPSDLEARKYFASLGVASALGIPWGKPGSTMAIMYLHSSTPRQWTDAELATVEKVLERLMGWTERENAIAREQMMAAEVDHRARNVLTLLKSLVRMTGADDVESLRSKLSERIVALSTVHTLLTRRRWRSVTLEAIVGEEVAPYADEPVGRVSASGPDVSLEPSDAQLVGMIVHELVTNAVKYGALSCAGGKLDIQWTALDQGGFRLLWKEQSPEPRQPGHEAALGTGFGSDLLYRVVTEQLGGSVERRDTPGGLILEIVIPLQPVD